MEVSMSKLANPPRLVIELRGGQVTRPIPVSPIAGPALKLSPTSATPGSVASMMLSLSSPSGQEPAALQWELAYPSPQLGMGDDDMLISKPAKVAGKSLKCAGRPESAGIYIYQCILAGGEERIPNGPVALLSFQVRSYARQGPASVRLSKVLGVSADGKKIGMEPSQTEVTVQ
jgi:hypothetical protein